MKRSRGVFRAEKGLLQSRSSRREPEFVWGFFTGINRVLKASFLNRTPKEKLANEAAAGGEGPPHTPALGRLPAPDPQRGSPERPFKVPGIFPALPCPAFLVTTNKEREKWEPQGERGEGERAAGGGGEEQQQQQHLPRDGRALPGRIQPTKWAQFANSPRPGRQGPAAAAAAGGGARRRLRPGPAALLPPGARSRPDFPGGGARRRGRGRRRGAAAFSSLSGPFSGLPRLRQGLGTAGEHSSAGKTGGRGQRVKPPPRPAQTSAAVCSPNPHPGRRPRTPLPGRRARSGRPPRRRGKTSRLRYGARFSRRLGERWRRWRRHWENGGRASFPSPPLI